MFIIPSQPVTFFVVFDGVDLGILDELAEKILNHLHNRVVVVWMLDIHFSWFYRVITKTDNTYCNISPKFFLKQIPGLTLINHNARAVNLFSQAIRIVSYFNEQL